MTGKQPHEAEKPKPKGNINDWAIALSTGNTALSKMLSEERSVGFDKLAELNLPRYAKASVPLTAFMKDPAGTFGQVVSDEFYVVLNPHSKGTRRFSRSGVDAQGVLNFVDTNVPPENQSQYDMIVQQYYDNKYGGNIIVNPDGRIYAEFKDGKQSEVAKGTVTPNYTASNDPFTGTFRYSFEDIDLRTSVYKTIGSIPHTGTARDAQYLPGYYEFVLVQPHDSDPLQPIFIDYKDNSAYFLPDTI